MLRSHFANENIPTEVDFTFESNSKIYNVKRNPEYERKSKRGDKTTRETANAVLTFITDSNLPPITKSGSVTEKIEEILKISKDQFCRIAMIAQGAFQKLLLSKTEEKKTIFRKLFNTQKYELLQERLQEEDAGARTTVEKINASIRQYLSGIDCDEPDEKNSKVIQIKKNGFLTDDDLNCLKTFLEQDEQNLCELKNSIEQNDAEIEKINSKLESAQDRLQKQNELLKIQKEFELKNAEKENFAQALENALSQEKQKPALQNEKSVLENSMSEYSEIDRLQNELQADMTSCADLQTQNDLQSNELEKLKSEIQNLKTESETLKSSGENKIEYESKIQIISTQTENLQNIKDNLQSHSELKKNYDKKIQEYKKSEDEYQNANLMFIEKRRLFNFEQAGILAETLQDSQPCPVCGSTVHPKPAKKSENAPTEKEVEELERRARQLQKESSQKSSEASELKAKLEAVLSQARTDLKRCLGIEDFNPDEALKTVLAAIAENSSQVCDLQNKIKDEDKKISRKNALEKIIPEQEQKISECEKSINDYSQQIAALKTKNDFTQKTLEEKKSKLKYKTLQDAKFRLDELASQIQNIEKNIESARTNLNECENDIAGLIGTEKILQNQISSIKDCDMQKLQQQQTELHDKKIELNKARDKVIGRKEQNKNSITQLETIFPELQKAKSHYDMIHSLYKVVSGNISGQAKLSLETYVQMIFFDNIIRRANLRLKIMTDGKYELRRRQEFTDKRSSLGLELNVKDFYTGRERFVESLSGGEQFQASLALALGLADEIQNSAGGIKLDTMFIDEGFGTLDSETLNKAMKALEDLSKSNKLIGIISHVNELEDRIQNKIRVSKDDFGKSRISIET
ncbi:MAG: SbcC/MukB-like Walker B domain-containing protein [Treponema sp.]